MKSNIQIQNDVMEELKWEPSLHSSDIGVSANDGVVMLSGQVSSYFEKILAEKVARRIVGVKATLTNIFVELLSINAKTDAEIAAAVLNALRWNVAIKNEKLKIKVENGIVKLEGEVDWEFERSYSEKAIEKLKGIKMVINRITLKQTNPPSDIHQQIVSAFERHSNINSKAITIEIIKNKVVLAGKVSSLIEKEDAENIVWAAPGILSIDNRLEVELPA